MRTADAARSGVPLVALVLGSGLAAVMPLALLTLAVRDEGVGFGAHLALGLVVAGFAAQLVGSAEVEARLPAKTSLRLPTWVVVLAVAPVAGWLGGEPTGMYLAVVVGLVPLDVGRSLSTAQGRHRTELAVSGVLAGTIALAWSIGGGAAPVLAGIGIMASVAIRAVDQRGGSVPGRRPGWIWILLDTSVTGVVQPAVLAVAVAFMTPAAAVGFRTVTGVANVLSPVLGVVRLRLLSGAPRREMHPAVLGCCGLALALCAASVTGLFPAVFGEAWQAVTTASVLAAVSWKLWGLASTFPFAALRRAGAFAAVFGVRVLSSVLYLVLCVAAVLTTSDLAVLLGALCVTEALACCGYWIAVRGVAPADASERERHHV